MPVRDGFVGSQAIKVLRDSGCSTVVVRTSLIVKDYQLLKTRQKCVLLDGTARNVPVARIDIDSPYYRHSKCALYGQSSIRPHHRQYRRCKRIS